MQGETLKVSNNFLVGRTNQAQVIFLYLENCY